MTDTLSDTIPLPHLQRLLEEITQRKGLKKPRYAVSEGSKAGDNYLGVLFRADVYEGEAAEPTLRLILKGMPASQKRREEMTVVIYYRNECAMYQSVLPSFAAFLADKGFEEVRHGDQFPCTARCVEVQQDGAEGEDALVLEDMRPQGFTMHDRQVGLDEHHIRTVLRAQALLHAASFAMEDQRPEEFAKARDNVHETLFKADNPLGSQLDELAQRTYGYIEGRFPEGSEGYKKVKVIVDNYMKTMLDLVSPDANGGNAISHGDCWTNNLLFKYSKSGAVEDVCLLDFQLSRYAPPILDIVYLVYSCTVREMRDKHLDRLLREYHDQLTAHLRRLGCDPDKIYPWEKMQAQLRERGRYGLGMAIMTIPIFLADASEIPDLDAQFEDGKAAKDIFNVESKNAAVRDHRICDVLQEMLDRGWM